MNINKILSGAVLALGVSVLVAPAATADNLFIGPAIDSPVAVDNFPEFIGGSIDPPGHYSSSANPLVVMAP